MNIMLGIYMLFLGLVIGSFLNVVIYRFNAGTTLTGRSMCFSCGKQLRWYELVPLFSFLFQRGRCRGCRSKISWQYPIVELLTGLLFLGAFLVAKDILHLAYLCIQLAILVVISVYDLRHKIIPDLFSFLFAGLALCFGLLDLFSSGFSWGSFGLLIIAGPVYFLPFAAMWYLSKGTWMGFGDAKLALGIGWFLGIGYAYIAMMIAFWTGALVGVGLIVYGKIAHVARKRAVTMKSEIPFGPFLILGVLVMVYAGVYAEHILSMLMLYGEF